MRKRLEIIGAAILALIPITSLLVLFGFAKFPNAHRYMGYLIAAYLALVLVLLTREILLDARGRRERNNKET